MDQFDGLRSSGYLARAHDPPPSNTVIWRGWSRLMDIKFGAMLSNLTCGQSEGTPDAYRDSLASRMKEQRLESFNIAIIRRLQEKFTSQPQAHHMRIPVMLSNKAAL